MAYYFAFIWYALIAFFSFVYIMNIDKMDLTFMDFIDSKYFRMFWNFPLYIFMEILFLSLIFYDNRVEKEITSNSDTIDDIHVIIPAHKANETIKGNIGHLVDLFHYNIWIAENLSPLYCPIKSYMRWCKLVMIGLDMKESVSDHLGLIFQNPN